MGEGGALATLGIIAGLAAALGLTRLLLPLIWAFSPLGGLLYEVSLLDTGTFAGMTALPFAVALLASNVPAWRAGRIDPVRALKGGE